MEYEDDIDALYATYQDLLPMAEADSERLWQKFRLDWNYNSNRIEGNTLTYGETEALLILGTEPKRIAKDIREMKAHDMGIEYLLSLTDHERPISEADIRTLNQIILKENYWITSETADGNISEKEIVPGTYKKMPNHVRLRGGGIHKFAEPNEVPIRMATVVKRLRNYLEKQDKPLAAFLAELHQYFIQTHPFDDGNGRVVRMLLNYVCLKRGWPVIIIKDKNKKDYLASLEQWDKGNQSDLEAIMKAELIWSVKKSIAAARGEDIDDPDDLDKEIDLFVRENTPNPISIPLDYDAKEVLDKLIIPIAIKIEEKITQFSPLFEQVYEMLPHSAIRLPEFKPYSSKPQKMMLDYEMFNYLKASGNITLSLIFTLEPRACLLDYNINYIVSNVNMLRQGKESKNLLGVNKNSQIEGVVNNIIREIFDIIKSKFNPHAP